MTKISKHRWVIAWMVASALIILLGTLPIDNRVLGSIALACLALGILIVLIVICASFHRVPEDLVDIAYTFGRYRRTLRAGLRFRYPWQRVVARLRVGESFWICPPQLVPLSYNDSVILSCAVSYQLVPEDAHLAMRASQNWEETFHELLVTSLQDMGTTFFPDDFLGWSLRELPHPTNNDGNRRSSPWERVNLYLLRLAQERAARLGVQVNWVGIRDVRLAQQVYPKVTRGQPTVSPSDSDVILHVTQHSYPTEVLTPSSKRREWGAGGKRRGSGGDASSPFNY